MLSNGSYDDHLQKVDLTLQRLQKAGLKVCGKKYKFTMQELEYLGCLITWEGIKPIPKKTSAILDIKPPKTVKQLQSFLGLINYYHDT